MSIYAELDEACPACGKANLAMTVTSKGVAVDCLCGRFEVRMSQKAEGAQGKVLQLIRNFHPKEDRDEKARLICLLLDSEYSIPAGMGRDTWAALDVERQIFAAQMGWLNMTVEQLREQVKAMGLGGEDNDQAEPVKETYPCEAFIPVHLSCCSTCHWLPGGYPDGTVHCLCGRFTEEQWKEKEANEEQNRG